MGTAGVGGYNKRENSNYQCCQLWHCYSTREHTVRTHAPKRNLNHIEPTRIASGVKFWWEKNSVCARAQHRACERYGKFGNREASRVRCAGGAGGACPVCAGGQWHTTPGPISNRALRRLNYNALPGEICPCDALFVFNAKNELGR